MLPCDTYQINPKHPDYNSTITDAIIRCELIAQKTKPSMIVLEETDDDIDVNVEQEIPCGDTTLYIRATKIWRIKDE